MNRQLIYFLSFVLMFVAFLSIYQNPFISNWLQTHPFVLSQGDKYLADLNLWQVYAKNNDWHSAAEVERRLNSVDIQYYKDRYEPESLIKRLNTLVVQSNKTADSWLEITRINLILGKIDDAKLAISQAHQIDPIRDDITRLFYQLVQ